MSMSIQKFYTTRLCSRSSVVSGAANVFNIFGNFYKYNYSESFQQADARALRADWNAVGEDLKKSIEYHRTKK